MFPKSRSLLGLLKAFYLEILGTVLPFKNWFWVKILENDFKEKCDNIILENGSFKKITYQSIPWPLHTP